MGQDIVEIASGMLSGDELAEFMDFYGFLAVNKLGRARTSANKWAFKYKNKKIGHFSFHGGSWSIDFFDLFPRVNWFEMCEKYMSDELKDFVLNNINTASSCCVRRVCHSVEGRVILGRMFEMRVCACTPVMISGPSGEALERAKELALIGRDVAADLSAARV